MSNPELVRLESPWGWLSIEDAMLVASLAYRVASHGSRHVQARDVAHLEHDADGFNQCTTEDRTMQEMRQDFCGSLSAAFNDLLSGLAVQRGACWPDSPQLVEIAARFAGGVPADWRPENPQLGTFEPGKVAK